MASSARRISHYCCYTYWRVIGKVMGVCLITLRKIATTYIVCWSDLAPNEPSTDRICLSGAYRGTVSGNCKTRSAVPHLAAVDDLPQVSWLSITLLAALISNITTN